jgi:hypothetical protein
MSDLYKFDYSGYPSSVQIELIGGPGDGLFAPMQTAIVVTPPLEGDPEEAVGHGYAFKDDPPQYRYIGLLFEDIFSEDGDDE